MKPVHLVTPVIALAIAGGWIGAQQQKISQLENETVILRKHIASEQSQIETQRTATEPTRPTKPEIAKDGIDWLDIAAVFGDMHKGEGVGDMRKMIAFQSKLQKMNKEQLLAALDEIQKLELKDEERMMLEAMLISPLALKDPELLLNRFSDRLDDENSGMSWQLANALGEWAKKDQTAAIAWFDKAIAEGIFESKSLDGKSQIRLHFEMNLISQLVSIDPALAQARISALPADQRKDALSGYGFQSQKAKDQVAHANLVRANLSAEETYEVFGQQASMIAMMGSLEKVDAYLEGIGANGEERIKVAEKAAISNLTSSMHRTKVTEEKIESVRKWLGTQAPGSVDRVTGESLGQMTNMGGSMNFSQAAAMVMKYHAQGGGDDLLTSFVDETQFGTDKEEARKIAEKISDPEKREEALEKLK